MSLRSISLYRTNHVPLMLLMTIAMFLPDVASAKEWLSGIKWPEPAVVEPGKSGGPPADAIVLFDGKSLDAWEGGHRWKIKDGVAIAHGSGIVSKQSFGDCQLHVEWSAPVKIKGREQQRGNSGLFMMQNYEVQILDSYNNPTYFDGQAGAIYKQTPPMVNVMRKPGEWNKYDVIFTAPHFKDDGSVKSPAYLTVIHNGVVVQNHYALQGTTAWHLPPKYTKHAEKLPIGIQFHGNPVRFRNIWIRETKPVVGVKPVAKNGEGKKVAARK